MNMQYQKNHHFLLVLLLLVVVRAIYVTRNGRHWHHQHSITTIGMMIESSIGKKGYHIILHVSEEMYEILKSTRYLK